MFDKLVNTLRHGRNMHAVQFALSKGILAGEYPEGTHVVVDDSGSGLVLTAVRSQETPVPQPV